MVQLPGEHELLFGLDLSPSEYEIQVIQTRFRRCLVEAWQLVPGSKIVEIGCGQGDMTLVLCAAVGPHGHVTALDAAEATYGGPVTLGEAANRIRRSTYAQPITFMFGADILHPTPALPLEHYDYAVLAHSSWYFASPDHLHHTLRRIAHWSDRLCFSEWDLQPTKPSQILHLLAVLFQGRMAALAPDTAENIRALMSRSTTERIVEDAGWHIDASVSIDTTELQDGRWEVGNYLALLETVMETGDGAALQGLDFDDIGRLARCSRIESLSSFALECHRR